MVLAKSMQCKGEGGDLSFDKFLTNRFCCASLSLLVGANLMSWRLLVFSR